MGLAVSKQEQFWDACGFGNWYRVRKYIEEGVDVNKISFANNSYPIHVASQGKSEVVKLLIEANCDVNLKDEFDKLAIHHAAMKGHADIIFMLLDAGSEINCQDRNGWTPLICAGYWAYPEAVWTLIDRGADVNLKNKDNRNVLHEVCRSPSKDEEALGEIAKFLLDAKVDLDQLAGAEGWMEAEFTPLMFSAYHGHTGVASVLLDRDCEINTQGMSNNWTALHWAANRGHLAMVELLLEYGLDANVKGYRGETPLRVAKTNEIKHTLAPFTQGYENIGFINTDVRPPVTTDEGSESESESEVTSPSFDNAMSSDSETTDKIDEQVSTGLDQDQQNANGSSAAETGSLGHPEIPNGPTTDSSGANVSQNGHMSDHASGYDTDEDIPNDMDGY